MTVWRKRRTEVFTDNSNESHHSSSRVGVKGLKYPNTKNGTENYS